MVQYSVPKDTIISNKKSAWLNEFAIRTPAGFKTTRACAIMQTLVTMRARGQTVTMFDNIIINGSMSEGDPAAVIQELESKHKGFFDGFPSAVGLTDGKKKMILSEFCRSYLAQGITRFGKYNGRSKAIIEAEEAGKKQNIRLSAGGAAILKLICQYRLDGGISIEDLELYSGYKGKTLKNYLATLREYQYITDGNGGTIIDTEEGEDANAVTNKRSRR